MLMPGRYVSDTAQKCVTINTTVLVPVVVKVYLVSDGPISYKNGDPNTVPVHQLPVASMAALEHPYVYHYNDAASHPEGQVVSAEIVEGRTEYNISLSEEPSGGVTAFFIIHPDTNVTNQEVGFDLDLPSDVYAEVRVRQYHSSTGEEYDEALGWMAIDMSGGQQLSVPMNKAAIGAGGKTILELRYSSSTAADFPGDVLTGVRNFYYKITHYEPQTRIATICDEKDSYRFGFWGGEKDNEMKGIGNSVDLDERMMDTRIGRLGMTVDPLAKQFPWQSPYVAAGNSPITNIDKNGEYKYPKGKAGDEQKGRYPLITKYLSSQIEKDVANSTRIIAAYRKVNPNISEQTIIGLAKWDQGYIIAFVDGPGKDDFGDPTAAGYAEEGVGQPIELNAGYAKFVEEVLASDASDKVKQTVFTRFYMTLLHETAHKNNELTRNVGPGSDGNDNYLHNTNGITEMEVGDIFEQEVWGYDGYNPTIKDPEAARKPAGAAGIKSEKYREGVTEGVIDNANQTEEGKKTLPTVPSN